MKRNAILVCIVLMYVLTMHTLQAKNLRAYTLHNTFKGPNNTTIIEHYTAFDAHTAQSSVAEGGYRASIRVGMLVTDTKGNIVYANKYNVLSPIQKKQKLTGEFINVQRFALPSGTYTLALEFVDNYDTLNTIGGSERLSVPMYADSLQFSSMELVDNFVVSTENKSTVKNGFDITPYVSNYYGDGATQLNFYVELYNAALYLGAEQGYLTKYYLKNADTKAIVDNTVNITRHKATDKMGFFGVLPLANLPTGNYQLCTDVIDKTNNIRAHNELFIQRYKSNEILLNTSDSTANFFVPITSNDSLNNLIRSIRPIANAGQKGFIDNVGKDINIQLKQQFLYNFWVERNTANPRLAFDKYAVEVAFVNKKYATNYYKGYQADRGRVYLQYGKPSTLSRFDHEPNSYPYEIWQYNTTNKRNNRRFVFYMPELATNNYKLLHSDAVGEIRNEKWQLILTNRDAKNYLLDQTTTPAKEGEYSKEVFENPR